MDKQCGQAGEGISLLMVGACGKDVELEEAYRCTGCGKWFHFDCIFNHFELDKGTAHNSLFEIKKMIKDYLFDRKEMMRLCNKGLKRAKPTISFPKLKDKII